MAQYRVRIIHDDMAESPEYDMWEVQSFNTRHTNFVHPDFIDEDEIAEGMAFFLSYFEHGLCRWSLSADGVPPILEGDWRWDGVNVAGVIRMASSDSGTLAWWDSKDEAERREIIREFLEVYTDWCNGNVWGFVWERLGTCDMGHEHVTEPLDSVWGYIGDDIRYGVREYAPADATAENTEVVDEYGAVAYLDIWEREEA